MSLGPKGRGGINPQPDLDTRLIRHKDYVESGFNQNQARKKIQQREGLAKPPEYLLVKNRGWLKEHFPELTENIEQNAFKRATLLLEQASDLVWTRMVEKLTHNSHEQLDLRDLAHTAKVVGEQLQQFTEASRRLERPESGPRSTPDDAAGVVREFGGVIREIRGLLESQGKLPADSETKDISPEYSADAVSVRGESLGEDLHERAGNPLAHDGDAPVAADPEPVR